MSRTSAFVVLTLSLALAACNNDYSPNASTGPSPSVTGTFTLQTFDGSTIPVSATDPSGAVLTLEADTLFISGDATYRTVVVTSLTPSGGQPTRSTNTSTGTWITSGYNITLTDGTTGGRATGVTDGTSITLHSGSDVYVFHR